MRFISVAYSAIIVLTVLMGLVFLIFPASMSRMVVPASISGDQKYELSRIVNDLKTPNLNSSYLSDLSVAAELNNESDAQFKLGVIFEEGLQGTNRSVYKAAKWYDMAIANGHAGAKYRLALIQQPAGGVLTKDAYRLFRSASYQGHPLAMLEQAKALHKGAGTNVNLLKAAYWYKKAAALGVQEAHLGLGELYLTGHGLKKNPGLAIKHLTQASESGVSEAQYKLGMVYYLGLGTKADPVRADHWLREALKNGNRNAMQPLTMLRIA